MSKYINIKFIRTNGRYKFKKNITAGIKFKKPLRELLST